MKQTLMTLNVDQRYQAIRGFKSKFQLSESENIRNLSICYQTVVNTQNNISPMPWTYDIKLKEEHKIFIHAKTLFDNKCVDFWRFIIQNESSTSLDVKFQAEQ